MVACRLIRVLAVPAALAAVVLAAGPASAVAAPVVLLDRLSSPKGLDVDPAGNPLVGQGTFGPPGPVLAYQLHGKGHGTATELTEPVNVTDIAATDDGAGWAIDGEGTLYRQPVIGGAAVAVLDIIAYETAHPDPYNNDPTAPADESNPYGLTALGNDVLIADAANNSIIRVNPAGTATTIARFSSEKVATDHLGPDSGLPPTLDAEAVPTSIAVGPNGDVLVGQLMGFPFRPGSSHVWRLDPSIGDEVLCSVAMPEAGCSVYATGFTAINDIAYDTRSGTLYVYELAAGGVLAFEAGFEAGDFPAAVLLRVHRGKRTELAAGQLSQPGGVAVGRDAGHVLVTDGMFTEGRLLDVTR